MKGKNGNQKTIQKKKKKNEKKEEKEKKKPISGLEI